MFEDRTFTFVLKTPPASENSKKAAKASTGAADPLKDTAGSITNDQLRDIATAKIVDLNANDVEAAMKVVAGTALKHGIKIQDNFFAWEFCSLRREERMHHDMTMKQGKKYRKIAERIEKEQDI